MNKNALIEKIKSQLKALVSQKFAEIKAGDLMISTPDEELVVGSEVYTINADGVNEVLADGEYTLDNGVKIVVVGGKVEEMVAPEAESEVEVEVEAAEDVKPEEAPADEEAKTDEKSEEEVSMEARLSALESKVEEMVKKYEEVVKEKEEMKREFSKIAELPSTAPISIEPSEYKSVEDKKHSVGAPDIAAIRDRARKANR